MKKRGRLVALLAAGLLVFQEVGVSAEELFVSEVSEAEASDSVEENTGESVGEEISNAEISSAENSGSEILDAGTSDGEISGEESSEESASGEEASAEEFSDGENSGAAEASTDDFMDADTPEEGILIDSEEYSTDAGFMVDDTIFEEYGISLFSDDEAFSNLYGASSETYTGTYGAQLDGFNDNDYAAQCYELLVQKLTTNWSSAAGQTNISLTLDSTIEFKGNVTLATEGSTSVEVIKDESFYTAVKPLQEAVSAAWSAFLYDYPEAFWMRSLGYAYSYEGYERDSSDSTSATIRIKGVTLCPKTVYGDDTQTVINTFQSNVAAAVTELTEETEGATRYETVKAIHDYICEKAYYDSTGIISSGTGTDAQYQTHCAGPIFADDGGVVCEGYAKAVKILCDRMEISCACVIGKASSTGGTGEAHMWNYIQMENESWYLTDATWDDSSSGTIGEVYLLVGSDSDGKYVKISKERTNSSTFYTLTANTYISEYTVKNFVYPELSANSYLDDTTAESSTTTSETATESTTEEAGTTVTETDSAQTTLAAAETETATATTETPTEATTATTETPTEATTATTETPTEATTATTETPMEATTATTVTTTEGTPTATPTPTEADTVIEAPTPTPTPTVAPTITLSATTIPLKVKQSYTVKVSGLAAGDAVKSWKSNKPTVASVNQNGKITGKKAGTAKITVTLKSGLSRTITVKVQKSAVKTTKLSVSSKKITLKRGRTFKLASTVTVTPVTSKQKVTYKSSNKKVATVSSSGKITAKKKGTATITVQSGSKKVKVKVTVK